MIKLMCYNTDRQQFYFQIETFTHRAESTNGLVFKFLSHRIKQVSVYIMSILLCLLMLAFRFSETRPYWYHSTHLSNTWKTFIQLNFVVLKSNEPMILSQKLLVINSLKTKEVIKSFKTFLGFEMIKF